MIHAYDESYLNDAMNNLGEAVDYAVNCCHLTIDEFFDYFIASPFARQFERGVPKAIAGLSGSELVLDVLHQAGLDSIISETQIEYEYSPEYWCGWILAYYQWYTTRTFSNIRQQIPLQKFILYIQLIMKQALTSLLLQ